MESWSYPTEENTTNQGAEGNKTTKPTWCDAWLSFAFPNADPMSTTPFFKERVPDLCGEPHFF